MKTVQATVAPTWRLYLSDEIPEDAATLAAALPDALPLPSGRTVPAVDVDFSEGLADFNKISGRSPCVGSSALFAGRLFADADGEVLLGAGADWWWSLSVNGARAFDRGRAAFPDEGNLLASFSPLDWIFPVKVRKGENVLAFHIVSGNGWKVCARLLNHFSFFDAEKACDVSPEALAGLRLVGNTTRDPVGYQVGEDIDFAFELVGARGCQAGDLFLAWLARGEDGGSAFGFTPISARAPALVRTGLKRPGFVHVAARVANSRGESAQGAEFLFDGGAGAAIGEIGAAAARPGDFDAYWARQRARLDAVPVRADVERYNGAFFPDGTKIPDGLDLYKVRVDCAGSNPVTGLLAAPRGEGRHPARVVFDGYFKAPQLSHRLMTPGVVTLHINAHGYDLFRGPDYYDDFMRPFEADFPAYGFSPKENSDPDTAYFNGMALRVMRALDYVKTLPAWNGRDLYVQGNSQGGLQAIWAASLDPAVTHCECGINWCSNMAGPTLDARLPGWHPAYVRGLDYYDTVFHAGRIPETCFVDVVRVGLGDCVCPPSAVTAMYNAVRGPKRIAYYQNSTHIAVPPEPTIARRSSLWRALRQGPRP